jgi:hypothetical protein
MAVAMVGIHMLHGALLGLQQRSRVVDGREKLRRREIDDPAEPRDQMGAARLDPVKGEILEIGKGLGRGMGVQVPPSQVSHIIVTGHFGTAREHDSGALQGIAGGALVEHQGDPRVGKNVLGVHRKP